MKKTISIIITALLIVAIGYVLLQNPKLPENKQTKSSSGILQSIALPTSNVTIKDNIQYITVSAKGGYTPTLSIAKGGMPTKLIVKTDGTYDCSSSLVVRSTGYRGMLPATGETMVDLTSPKAGETIQGICSMGMYSFNVKFN